MIYKIIRKYNYINFLDLFMSKENELDPIEEIEQVEQVEYQVEQNEESDYEDDEVEQEDLKVYVPISLDDSYFGTVKKFSRRLKYLQFRRKVCCKASHLCNFPPQHSILCL
jgi:hypothetical protein